jgi:hypothetical protein
VRLSLVGGGRGWDFGVGEVGLSGGVSSRTCVRLSSCVVVCVWEGGG